MFTRTIANGAEEPVRFAAGPFDLYGMLYTPASAIRGAVLLCPADGEERGWCLRTYVLLARRLAAQGQMVLRFEYAGQGESSGAYEETSVESRLGDMRAALEFLQGRCGGVPIAAIGARLGSALALELTARERAIDRMVLIEPVLDTAAYARNLVRINLTMQMVVHKKVVRETDQLLEDLAAGGYVNANGYKLSKVLLDGLERMTPADRLTSFTGETLIVATPANRLPASSAHVIRKPFPPFWKEPKGNMTPPAAIIDAAASWLDERLPGRMQ